MIPLGDVERWRLWLLSGRATGKPTLHTEKDLLLEMIEDRCQLSTEIDDIRQGAADEVKDTLEDSNEEIRILKERIERLLEEG